MEQKLDEDETADENPKTLDTDPVEVVLKGGSPWGFTLKGGVELRSPIQISEIEPEGKAALCGQLFVGDYILNINGIKCVSLIEAVQLIQSAFRTLTLSVWRGASKLESSVKILRSSSFLQRAREVHERERTRLGLQDDTVIPHDLSSTTSGDVKMKPRQRRVESFHGKTGHPRLSSSGSTNAVSSPLFPEQPQQQEVTSRLSQNPQNDLSQDQIDASKLKGWATVQDLTGKRLTPANVDQQRGQLSGNIDQQRGPMSSVGLGNKMTEPHSYYTSYGNSPSSTSVLSSKPEMNVVPQSPQSPKSPNWTSSASPYSPPSGFQKVQPDLYLNRSSSHQSYQSSEHQNQVLNSYLTDDYSSKLPKSSSKSERRSLPPQFLHQKSDYQNISELHSYTSSLTSPSRTMYPPKEEEECEPELRNMPSTYHSDNVDPRPPCSPPAPPVRDLSSLKYVQRNQSHEKYPSWPVTQPSIEPETSVSINSHGGMWQESGDGKLSEPKLQTVVEKNSPALNERKNGDENKRNASDPGFKKPIPFKNFIKRPKHMDLSAKNEESRRRQAELVEDIFNSKPGYPEPKYDQDGHRLGDDKYSVPSPPERDMSGLDQKTLTEKIQAIVSPSYERSSYHQSYSAHSHLDQKRSKFEPSSSLDTNKKDLYLEPNNNSTKKSQNTLGYKMVDSSTSPLQSPITDQKSLPSNTNKNKDRPSESIQLYSNDRHRSYIVKQMLCYNTGTQTEFGSSKDISGDKTKLNVDIQSSPKDEQQRIPLPLSEQRMSSLGAENRLSSHGSEPNMQSHVSEHRLSSQMSEPRMSSHGSEQRISSHGSDSDYGSKQSMDDSRQKFSDEDRIRLENDRMKVGESSHSMMKGSKSDRQLHDHPYHYDYSPSTAPMLRKLSQEYYSGRFQGSIAEKRMSSSSGHESDTRSPLSDFPPHNFGQFGELKEAESYNSVVIHPNENSLPFGRDVYESTSSESYMDYSSIEGERNSGYGKMDSKSFNKQRRSLDPSIFSQKPQTARSMYDSRYSSEANLQSPFTRDQRDHSRSMTSLPVKKLGSSSDDSRIQSSSSNQYMNSPDTRSSTSTAYGSENSPHFNFNNQSKNLNKRHDSDSVFVDPDRSPAPVSKQEVDTGSPDNQSSRLGRNMSIKMAYGTAWMDSEQAKLGAHKRQESDITSNSSHSTDSTGNISHGRSQSLSDYMQMDHLRSSANKKLGLIREDSLEHKLDSESYKKFKSGDPSKKEKQTYENFELRKNNFNEQPRFRDNMLKRTSSEQIRPMKDKMKHKNKENSFDQNQFNVLNSARSVKSETRETTQSPARSPMDSQKVSESSYSENENKNVRNSSSSSRSDIQSDSDVNKQDSPSPVDPNAGSDIKKLQRDAVQNYIERIAGPKDVIVDDEHIYQDPSIAMTNADRHKSTKITPSESFRQKYAARRAESLRRSRSISSKDSSEYMEMKRPDKNHPQTEWSRIRSQTSTSSEGSKRPHSIGSDISLVDAYAVTPISPMNSMHDPREFERNQIDLNGANRTSREIPPAIPTSAAPSVSSHQLTSTSVGNQENRSSTGGTGSVSSLIYENVGYRRPPPVPPPPGDDEKPPALPPRNYRRFQNSQSDSSLINRQNSVENNIDPALKQNGVKNKCENSPAADSYAQQLRIQARRLSEHQLKPTPSSMSYKTTKMQINYSQSYKRTPAEVLEATPPKSATSEQQQVLHSDKPQSPTSTHSVSPNLTNQFPLGSQPANQNINSPSSNQVKAWQSVETNQTQNSNMDISNRFYSPESRNKSVPSPTPRRRDSSPGLPPPPTPIKNGETEIKHIDNMDLPPPPPEIMNSDQSSEKENTREGQGHDGYADDSFGSYKSKSGRQIGVYKRSQSAGDVLKAAGTSAENIQKPPRKRLQQQDYKSEQSLNTDNYSSEQPPEQKGVPTFKASESVPIKSTAKPLQKVSGNSLSSSFLISPKPFNSTEIAKSQNTTSMKSPERPSVRDRIFNFEKHSPLESGQAKSKTETSSAVDLLKKSFGSMGQSPGGPQDPEAENIPAMPKRTYLNSPRYTPSKFSSSYSEGSSSRFTGNEPVQSRSMYEPPKSGNYQSDSNSPQTPQMIERRGSGTSRGDMRFPRQDSDRSVNYSSPKGGSENSSVQNEVSNNQSLANSSYGANRYNYRKQSGDTDQSLQNSFSNPASFKNDSRQDLSLRNDQVLNERLANRDSSDSNYNKHSNDYNKGYHNQSPSENRSKNSNQNYSPNVSANLNNNNNNNDVSKENEVLLVNHARQRSKEELECDEKVQEFAIKVEDKDKKLSEVLKTDIDRMRYMEGIIPQNLPRKNSDTHRSPKSSSVSEHPKVAVEIKDKVEQSPESKKEADDSNRKDSSPLPSTYWVSPSKAMIEMDIRRSENMGKEMTKEIEDSDTLVRTKEQLVESIMKKVDKLKEEKVDLNKEIDDIEKIGKQVVDVVQDKCHNQNEKDKFKSYVQDSEKIIRLLLKLSGLLARAENALQSLPENADQRQKKMATDKRDNYKAQHEEAKKLKEDIDKRSDQVAVFLKECLSETEYEDYNYYVQMKSKLTIEMQELEDKLMLGEEQIQALKRSIPDRR